MHLCVHFPAFDTYATGVNHVKRPEELIFHAFSMLLKLVDVVIEMKMQNACQQLQLKQST